MRSELRGRKKGRRPSTLNSQLSTVNSLPCCGAGAGEPFARSGIGGILRDGFAEYVCGFLRSARGKELCAEAQQRFCIAGMFAEDAAEFCNRLGVASGARERGAERAAGVFLRGDAVRRDLGGVSEEHE